RTFLFNGTAPTAIYTLSLHDALPILYGQAQQAQLLAVALGATELDESQGTGAGSPVSLQRCQPQHHEGFRLNLFPRLRNRRYFRSEEHTSELQSRENLVCRLLLEKKK